MQEQFAEQFALPLDSVKIVWSMMLLFLESNWVSFCRFVRIDQIKHGAGLLLESRSTLISLSSCLLERFICPFKFESLKSSVEDILGSFCIGLKATYSYEVFNTFFGILMFMQVANESSSIASG